MTLTDPIPIESVLDGECDCGTSLPIGSTGNGHTHTLVCPWGVIEHPAPRPDVGEIGPLMLAMSRYVHARLRDGPALSPRNDMTHAVTRRDGRLFAHIAWDGRSWTWELFPAYWSGYPPREPDIYVGRWPD